MIVKCSKCGSYIHKANKCFHCGNTSGFDDIGEEVVHENIAQDYAHMEVLIEDKKFDEAISLSYKILEWMPNLAGVFWLRLLARNKCSTAIELISKGFPCSEDADFYNALSFSTGEEHTAYEDIKKVVSEIRTSLKKKLHDNEYRCKADTDIMHINRTMQDEINGRKQKLFTLWSDLEDTEHSLYELEMNCRLLTKEYQTCLEQAEQYAYAIKYETHQMKECTAEKLHSFQVRMGNALQLSESSKNILESMKKQHPWVKAFADLVSQRNQKEALLTSEIASLASYERAVQQTINEIEHIEGCHKAALVAIDKYDFTDAATLLGEDVFNQILSCAGVATYCSIDVSYKNCNPTSSIGATQQVETDNKMDTEDYYAAWGLNKD